MEQRTLKKSLYIILSNLTCFLERKPHFVLIRASDMNEEKCQVTITVFLFLFRFFQVIKTAHKRRTYTFQLRPYSLRSHFQHVLKLFVISCPHVRCSQQSKFLRYCVINNNVSFLSFNSWKITCTFCAFLLSPLEQEMLPS